MTVSEKFLYSIVVSHHFACLIYIAQNCTGVFEEVHPFCPILTVLIYHTGVTISLQQHEYTVDEDEGTVLVCAEITGETERNVTVYLHVEEYTALGMCMYIWTHTKCNLTRTNHSIPMPQLMWTT